MADLTSGSTSSVHCPFDSGPLDPEPACPDAVVGVLDLCFDDDDAAMDAADACAAAVSDRAALDAVVDAEKAARRTSSPVLLALGKLIYASCSPPRLNK